MRAVSSSKSSLRGLLGMVTGMQAPSAPGATNLSAGTFFSIESGLFCVRYFYLVRLTVSAS